MDLTSKVIVKNLLQGQGIRPSKRLGQNFLIDREVLKKIIQAAELQPGDTVLEIGPGLGTLTQELAKRAKKVMAVEKDQKMVEILEETLKDFGNVEVIKGDILSSTPGVTYSISNTGCYLLGNSFKVVGNLPFYLTTPVIRKFLEAVEVKPQQMVLMVQKEVAQRICAKPPDMNLLAASVQFYSEPKIISHVSKNSFWPRPKVDAAIIKITPSSRARSVLAPLFFRIVKAGFSQPRKQLINNLSRGLKIDKEKTKNWLLKNGVQPTQRAETLEIKDWINLAKDY